MNPLWRISNRCDLEGVGGEKADGRWHTAAHGKRIVYLAEHPALSLIEVLANLHGNLKLLPDRYQLIKLVAAGNLSINAIHPDDISESWRENPNQTRALGDTWLAGRSTALLMVPSAPSPESSNYLFNPLHPEAKTLHIEWCKWIQYDRRLFRLSD